MRRFRHGLGLVLLTMLMLFGCKEPEAPILPSVKDVPTKIAPKAAKKISAQKPNLELQFVSEIVQMTLMPSGKEVEIIGRYWFQNPTEQKMGRRIYFPFAMDEDHPFPHQITLSNGKYTTMDKGILFPVMLEPLEKKEVTITYRQAAGKQTATYIVTSALTWKKPIGRAEFQVVLPMGFQMKQCSFPLGEVQRVGNKQKWQFIAKEFVPARDMTVSWEAGSAGLLL